MILLVLVLVLVRPSSSEQRICCWMVELPHEAAV
jgi:hypothetical protein